MTTKFSQKIQVLKRNWVYFLVAIVVMLVAIFGSQDKLAISDQSMNMASIAASNYQVTTDQITQFYMVAELANDLNLASANLASINYTTIQILQQNSQIIDDSGKIQKPTVIDAANIPRGVVNYTVQPDESMEQIAARFGITTDQIRWSNNLKTTAISAGQTLLIPTVPGIVYTVKSGDTVESVAEKYKSSAEQIISVNDLEKDPTLTPNSLIIVPSGILPETERPEYVAPTPTYSNSSSYSNYYASYASGNRYAYGWCTWYAWQWRHDNMPANYNLPSNMGNANTWASAAASAGFTVNRTPAYGAVFQTSAGWLGHVGVVLGVNADGSVVISDMNGIAGWGRVGTKTITAAQAAQYTYIHGR
ncbi:LysM peptidoglycan-binding domain-containing protein [Candidatus Saccharibacteria bacterium]|nr:LysM peptidoglycan-binding domain-containing protein [Candidatus Saccharibacteria bacterium]MBR0415883.1 LysM peptidoglycan-binding domain-containing protein [Candidatus Saccharibacteria bacterium]